MSQIRRLCPKWSKLPFCFEKHDKKQAGEIQNYIICIFFHCHLLANKPTGDYFFLIKNIGQTLTCADLSFHLCSKSNFNLKSKTDRLQYWLIIETWGFLSLFYRVVYSFMGRTICQSWKIEDFSLSDLQCVQFPCDKLVYKGGNCCVEAPDVQHTAGLSKVKFRSCQST